jgi:hypothetical protein
MIRRKAKTSRIGFRIGMRVRVKRHIMDPDYPELPLGGWHGQIIQSQERPNRTYLVRWSRETLENIHPVYRERCEADDVCFDQTWLVEGDLEPDPGGPLSLEHPMISRTHAQKTCPC